MEINNKKIQIMFSKTIWNGNEHFVIDDIEYCSLDLTLQLNLN